MNNKLYYSSKIESSVRSFRKYPYSFEQLGPALVYNNIVRSTPNKSNLQGKLKKVRVIGSLSYWEFEANN